MRAGMSVVVVALLLGACAARVPPASRPHIAVPESWRSDSGGEERVPSTWWASFDDPVLVELAQRARERNSDLALAAARLREYGARLDLASAARLPALAADGGAGRARALAPSGAPRTGNLLQAGVSAAWELDPWGRLARTEQAAAAALGAEQAGADALALAIGASVASGYLNLRGLDAQLELALATLALRERSRDLARGQFEAGYSAELEWLQAQSEAEAAAEQLPVIRRAIAEQENALALLCGDAPGAIARGVPVERLQAPVVPAGLPSMLLRRRPDIARAERVVAAADATLAATRDQLLPTLRLTANGGAQAETLSEFVHSPLALWRLGGMLAAPLFDGGRVQAQTDAAAAQRDQAIHLYESTVRGAFVEVDNALASLGRLREQLVQVEARRRTAARTLRLAHERYQNGYASYLEELDAQRIVYAADVTRLQLKTRILVASVDLIRALGGGWEPIP